MGLTRDSNKPNTEKLCCLPRAFDFVLCADTTNLTSVVPYELSLLTLWGPSMRDSVPETYSI